MCVKGLRRHKILFGKRDIATAQPDSIILDSRIDSQPSEKRPATVLGVIPARLASTRLARKVLRTIAGRPMLAWVYEAASACPQLDRVVIATDSDEVAELCHQNNWPVQLTSADLPSGTDRVHAVAQQIPADIYVNIQGDEPLLKPEHLTALLRPFAQPQVEVSTLKVLCTPENIANPNAVKVVTAADGRALYFSRATIPYDRDAHAQPTRRNTGSTSASTPTAKPRSSASPPCPPAPSNKPSASNNSASSKTASTSTSNPPTSTP